MEASESPTTGPTHTGSVDEPKGAFVRVALDSLPAHIAVLDGSGTIVLVNQAWERFARENGDPALAHTGVGQNYLDVTRRAGGAFADEAPAVLAALEAVLSGARPGFSIPYACPSPAEQRWFLMRVTPLASGQLGAVVSHEAITEHRQAEHALRESEARFRALWDSAAEAMVLSDLDGVVLAANPACARLYGHPVEEVVGQDFSILFPEESRTRAREHYCQAWASPESVAAFEFVVPGADGPPRIVESRIGFLTQNGRRTGVLSILRDITERKQAEASQRFLAEAGRRLAESLDYERTVQAIAHLAIPQLADWCVVHLADGQGDGTAVVVAQPDAEKATRTLDLWPLYPADPQAALGPARVLRTGQPELVGEVSDAFWRTVADDEQKRQALQQSGLKSYLIVPLQARGRILGTMTWMTAQSRRHYTPVDLALAQEAARLAAQALDNARLYALSQQALHQRDEFLSIVSHDLRNPLMTITGYVQLLQRRLERGKIPDPDRFGEGLARIDGAARKMGALVNQLLDLGRLQAGRALPLHLQPTDLVQLVKEVAAEHKPQAEGCDLRVIGTEPELVGIWDTERLERVISNMVSNAIKYSPEGGPIVLRLGREGNWAVVSIQDEGVGIPADDLPHIFERFHRARNVVGRIAGTGIGLSSARQTIEQHGGQIDVVSQEGNGSTFTLHLPLA